MAFKGGRLAMQLDVRSTGGQNPRWFCDTETGSRSKPPPTNVGGTPLIPFPLVECESISYALGQDKSRNIDSLDRLGDKIDSLAGFKRDLFYLICFIVPFWETVAWSWESIGGHRGHRVPRSGYNSYMRTQISQINADYADKKEICEICDNLRNLCQTGGGLGTGDNLPLKQSPLTNYLPPWI